MRLDDVLEALRRVAEIAEHGVLEVVLEHVLRILVRLCVPRRRAVHALKAGLIVVRLGAQDQRLNGNQNLQRGQQLDDLLYVGAAGFSLSSKGYRFSKKLYRGRLKGFDQVV